MHPTQKNNKPATASICRLSGEAGLIGEYNPLTFHPSNRPERTTEVSDVQVRCIYRKAFLNGGGRRSWHLRLSQSSNDY